MLQEKLRKEVGKWYSCQAVTIQNYISFLEKIEISSRLKLLRGASHKGYISFRVDYHVIVDSSSVLSLVHPCSSLG